MAAFTRIEKGMRWYVMRDLKRANAKVPAYKLLEGMKMEVFVPMKWHLVTRKGMRIREEVPFIQDLLFVHETQNNLDTVVEKTAGFTNEKLGTMFPILFVTVACGAVSGFHSLVSSGTSSKTVENEKDMLKVGYGAMILESLLAVLALCVAGAAALQTAPLLQVPRSRSSAVVLPVSLRCSAFPLMQQRSL